MKKKVGTSFKLPKSIQVGCYEVPIEQVKREFVEMVDDDTRIVGQYRGYSKSIILATERKDIEQAGTFFHEVIEAICGIYDLDLSHSSITVIGMALTQSLAKRYFGMEK